jgi:hypothetical protein
VVDDPGHVGRRLPAEAAAQAQVTPRQGRHLPAPVQSGSPFDYTDQSGSIFDEQSNWLA